MSNIYELVKIYGDITEADYPESYNYFFYEEVASAKASTKGVRSPKQARRNLGRSRKKIVYPVVLRLRLLTCCETREVDLWQATSSSSLVSVPSLRRRCLALPARFALAYAHLKHAKNNACSTG